MGIGSGRGRKKGGVCFFEILMEREELKESGRVEKCQIIIASKTGRERDNG